MGFAERPTLSLNSDPTKSDLGQRGHKPPRDEVETVWLWSVGALRHAALQFVRTSGTARYTSRTIPGCESTTST